ncbi:MAG: hypothetical protein JW847_08390 [Candidatus Omnitrophica bacterium]|nr:hypothetical protein [Candidatus Omnitrophota bacterium]
MAQERPTTPEKQLLDLIEDPKQQGVAQKKTKRKSFNLLSLSAFRGRVSFIRESIRSGAFFKNTLMDIRELNKLLKVFIALLLAYLIGNFIVSFDRLQKTPEFVMKSSRPNKEISLSELASKNISYYLEGPRSRNIFKFGDFGVQEAQENEGEFEVASPTEEALSQSEILAQRLGLVGIGWSDDPDVMVENVETKKIYFLKRGEKIDGLIKVEAVFEDRVILSYDNGKEMELR